MIKENVENLLKEIKQAQLIAVSKTRTIDEIKEAVRSGVRYIAENKVIEAYEKYHELKEFFKENNIEFHFIGHLQSNKAAKAVEIFDNIQSVDTLKIAEEINKRAGQINKVQRILIQVNIGHEFQKSGFEVDEVQGNIISLARLSNIRIVGLMCIAPYFEDKEKARPYFKKMKELFKQMKTIDNPNVQMRYLSMGMTNDYIVALQEGSNMIRVGTGIFGERII
jgi:PLP dependent protein